MLMKRTSNNLSGAPVTMRKLGKSTDSTILKKVIECPGVTVSGIAEALNWSNGRVDGSVNRLASKGKVEVKHLLQRGMLVKRVYPENHLAKPQNIVDVPEEMISKNLWKESAFVYALSRSTIGIAPEENKERAASALLREHADIWKEQDRVVITLPERLSNFYQLQNSDKSLATIGNVAMITVETILPVRLPSIHPEEMKFLPSFYRLEVERERLETVSTHGFFVYTRDKASVEIGNTSCSPYLRMKERVQEIVTVTNADPGPLRKPITIPVVPT